MYDFLLGVLPNRFICPPPETNCVTSRQSALPCCNQDQRDEATPDCEIRSNVNPGASTVQRARKRIVLTAARVNNPLCHQLQSSSAAVFATESTTVNVNEITVNVNGARL